MLQGDSPDWRPLSRVMDEGLLETFMWMFEVELEDGTRLHAYKHIWTRRYVHLDAGGAAYCYDGEVDAYRPVALDWILEAALRPWWCGLGASLEDVAASWAAIRRARRRR
jgi:hypothetical protein